MCTLGRGYDYVGRVGQVQYWKGWSSAVSGFGLMDERKGRQSCTEDDDLSSANLICCIKAQMGPVERVGVRELDAKFAIEQAGLPRVAVKRMFRAPVFARCAVTYGISAGTLSAIRSILKI